ncbi:MAG TPA: HEAT repeat domain-containing protein [Planctomycetota bacterium]|nr:HEAT repeat domain-containing protein [Planctomycetota bacterium]
MLAVLMAAALAGQANPDQAIKEFKEKFKAGSDNERTYAIQGLSRVNDRKVVQVLIPYLTTEAPAVRVAAARALGGMDEHKDLVLPALERAMGGPNGKFPDVRGAVLEAFGYLGDPAGLKAIQRAYDDREVSVVRSAVNATAVIKNGSSVSPLIDLLKRQEKKAREASTKSEADILIPEVNRALAQITGQSFVKGDDWSKWWSNYKGPLKK